MGRGKRRIGEIVVIVVEERVEELRRVVVVGSVEGVVSGVILACGGVCLGDKAQEVLIHGAVERETAIYYVIARLGRNPTLNLNRHLNVLVGCFEAFNLFVRI